MVDFLGLILRNRGEYLGKLQELGIFANIYLPLLFLKKYFKSQYCGFFLDWLVVTRADEIDLAGDCP